MRPVVCKELWASTINTRHSSSLVTQNLLSGSSVGKTSLLIMFLCIIRTPSVEVNPNCIFYCRGYLGFKTWQASILGRYPEGNLRLDHRRYVLGSLKEILVEIANWWDQIHANFWSDILIPPFFLSFSLLFPPTDKLILFREAPFWSCSLFVLLH